MWTRISKYDNCQERQLEACNVRAESSRVCIPQEDGYVFRAAGAYRRSYDFLLLFPPDVSERALLPREIATVARLYLTTVRARIHPVNSRCARGQTDSRYSLTTSSAGA